MIETSEVAPGFKDRTLGLVVFGVVSVLIGVVCALLVPLAFLSVALSESMVGAEVDIRSAWAAAAVYGLMAVAFTWLGFGSIRARRWACELLLALSRIWLLTGICVLIISSFVAPMAVGNAVSTSGMPPELTTLVTAVALGLLALINLVLPGLFVLFFRSPHVDATCRARDPRPQWTDTCPPELLTLTVLWVLFGISALLMPAYNFVFPFFGDILTGAMGAVLWTVVLVICVVLAMGTCRRAPWALWGGLGLILTAAISSVLSALRYELEEILLMMKMPQDQVAILAGIDLLNGWPMALITALLWATFFAYLVTLRGFFECGPEKTGG